MPVPASPNWTTSWPAAGILDPEVGLAAARIGVGVAAHFRHRRGDAGLVLDFESQAGRDQPGTLTGVDDVAVMADVDGEERPAQASLVFTTTIRLSSRTRLKSR